MMERADIIIIGAGAAGLMAARNLSAEGKSVLVLEAKSYAGGRIHTVHSGEWRQPVESGAEFIHGNLPLTLQLLHEAGIGYTKTEGDMLRSRNGQWQEREDVTEGWDELTQQMNGLTEDTTLSLFLQTHFAAEQYSELRESALQYAQGFDAVDPGKASVLALRDEWEAEEEDNYHVNGGYGLLIDFLVSACRQHNARIYFDKPVQTVEWKEGEVTVTTAHEESFSAAQVLVTVPLGVLAASEERGNCIRFAPRLPQVEDAVKSIGYGNVVKILLQFEKVFWQDEKEALFYITDEKIGTWWTQLPSQYPMLTGWIAGKKADEYAGVDDKHILQRALQSVGRIFKKPEADVQCLLTASHVVNWQKDIFSQGAYSYNMVGSEGAKKVMRTSVANTVFFAGEGTYSGISGGTVEAALVSGRDAAVRMTARA